MGLFSKIFSGSKGRETQVFLEDVLDRVIEAGDMDVSFHVDFRKEEDKQIFQVDFRGEDEDIFSDRDGYLLDAFQIFLTRCLQHNFKDSSHEYRVFCDSNNYREKNDQALLNLAKKLKAKVLDQGRPLYFRALPAKDRRVVHQFLSGDERVRSHSVGEGLYKKIKIYPAHKEQGDSFSTRS